MCLCRYPSLPYSVLLSLIGSKCGGHLPLSRSSLDQVVIRLVLYVTGVARHGSWKRIAPGRLVPYQLYCDNVALDASTHRLLLYGHPSLSIEERNEETSKRQDNRMLHDDLIPSTSNTDTAKPYGSRRGTYGYSRSTHRRHARSIL